MNKSKIDWCDYTWNPVSGCKHGCEYCYAQKIANRFASAAYKNEQLVGICDIHELQEPIYTSDNEKIKAEPFPFGFEPTFHKKRLTEPASLKKPQNIFVCSMGDLFGAWVPKSWKTDVYDACTANPKHNYLFLTKNPSGYKEMFSGNLDIKKNIWCGVTIENQKDANTRIPELLNVFGVRRFVSIEPIHGEIDLERIEPDNIDALIHSLSGTASVPFGIIDNRPRIDWVIVGAETGTKALKPDLRWVKKIVQQCEKAGVPVFLKTNLALETPLQQFPVELQYIQSCNSTYIDKQAMLKGE